MVEETRGSDREVGQPSPAVNRRPSQREGDHVFDRICLSLWAILCIALFAVTWKLWLPGFTSFPRVPFFFEANLAINVVQFVATIAVIGNQRVADKVIPRQQIQVVVPDQKPAVDRLAIW